MAVVAKLYTEFDSDRRDAWGTFPMVATSPANAEPIDEKYPPLVSLMVIACAASTCWAGIIGLTMALFR